MFRFAYGCASSANSSLYSQMHSGIEEAVIR